MTRDLTSQRSTTLLTPVIVRFNIQIEFAGLICAESDRVADFVGRGVGEFEGGEAGDVGFDRGDGGEASGVWGHAGFGC